MLDFAKFDDFDLILWLVSYDGEHAGFYPGIRRTRARARAEAEKRGLAWERALIHAPNLRPGRRHAISIRTALRATALALRS